MGTKRVICWLFEYERDKQTDKPPRDGRPKLLALTSLTPAEFMGLLSVFGPLCEHFFQHHDLMGRPRRIPKFEEDARCSLPGNYQKLFFLLSYLKENSHQHYHAERFAMGQSKVSKWLKVLLPLLEKALNKLERLPKRFGDQLYAFLTTFTRHVLLMDTTERPIPRSIEYERQKYEYSHRGAAVRKKLILSRTIWS